MDAPARRMDETRCREGPPPASLRLVHPPPANCAGGGCKLQVHRRFGCKPACGVRRAARPAVVPSQAPATVSIAESSADTFPAVYAPHPADASTCRASFPGACLAVEPGGSAGASAGPGRVSPPFVRSGSPRDRAAGIGDGWLPGRSGGIVPPSKNADGPLPHPHPSADPPPCLHEAQCRSEDRVPTPADHIICRPCNEIHEDPNFNGERVRDYGASPGHPSLRIGQVTRAGCAARLPGAHPPGDGGRWSYISSAQRQKPAASSSSRVASLTR
jgi:hypothetical protein